MEAKVKERQTMFDVALEYLGGAEGAFALAERNGRSITDPLPEGTLLRYEAADVVSEKVVERYAQERVSPATDIDDKELNTLLYGGEGIGYWRVGKNFKIMEN